MMPEWRADAAKYYDLAPTAPDDIQFYLDLIQSSQMSVLELGCGTGRVLVPMAGVVSHIVGIDHSLAMLGICQAKLDRVGLVSPQVSVRQGEISAVRLHEQFDLITAPFRVLQNLETDDEVHGLLETVRAHLSTSGTAVLNVFNPNRDRMDLIRDWCTPEEIFSWEVPVPGGRLTCSERRQRLDQDRLVLYPELVYRRYDGEEQTDEAVLSLVMRCYYPDEFEALIADAGFEVMNRWGGYHGEPYGNGPELVLQCRDA